MTFTFRPAVREATPLLVGITGPSGSGKTKSALRLATGIQSVRGGKIAALDTEANRMKHYAEEHSFVHCSFGAPFGSDRYAEALLAAAEEAAGGVVIVDSMSHEHEGPGGYLEYHEDEVQRLIKDGGFRNEYAASIPAWNKPVARRRRLINTLLQINCAFIFCFRAKEKLKIQKGKDPVQLGWQAIAGEEFVFEMTVRCLLLPGAAGVPDWSEDAFKLGVPKRAAAHVPMFKDGKPLDEETGAQLAQWAAGAQDWDKELATAPSGDKLAEIWARIPKAEKPKYEATKNTRKASLSTGAPI
jgi:energy-coupling factor transporter ATP-binding protein EcfA2